MLHLTLARSPDVHVVLVKTQAPASRDLFAVGSLQNDELSSPHNRELSQRASRGHRHHVRCALCCAGRRDWRPQAAAVKCPTLVIHGLDDLIPVASSREWAASFSDARLFPMPGFGHYPWREGPETFSPAARQFLQGTWPEGALQVTAGESHRSSHRRWGSDRQQDGSLCSGTVFFGRNSEWMCSGPNQGPLPASWRKTVRANVTTRWTVREEVRANLRVRVERRHALVWISPRKPRESHGDGAGAG
jgi:hypothetical protein